MNSRQLAEILQKREQIMNKKDEYIEVSQEDTKKEPLSYDFSKSIRELTSVIKSYTEERKKGGCSVGIYFLNLVAISGLIVINDYILLTYFV